jgi:hypothetical protein
MSDLSFSGKWYSLTAASSRKQLRRGRPALSATFVELRAQCVRPSKQGVRSLQEALDFEDPQHKEVYRTDAWWSERRLQEAGTSVPR